MLKRILIKLQEFIECLIMSRRRCHKLQKEA